MAEWVRVGRFDEIAEWPGPAGGDPRPAPGRFSRRRCGRRSLDRCPHAGGLLGHGWVEEGEVVCPLHRWRFRLRDGRCSTMRGEGVHRFPAEIRGDDVWVLV